MSRAFVKDDAPDGHVLIPPRPALPDGVANYVTPRGLRLLKEEREQLEAERGRVQSGPRDSADRSRVLAVLKGKLQQLEERISSARLVDPAQQPPDEVRFGATVTLDSSDHGTRTLTVVGVDESDPSMGRITFLAPVARRLIGKSVGDSAPMPTPAGDQPFRITRIEYFG